MEHIKQQLCPLIERISRYDPEDKHLYRETYSKVFFISHSCAKDKSKTYEGFIYELAIASIEEYVSSIVIGDNQSVLNQSVLNYCQIWDNYYSFLMRLKVSFNYISRTLIEKENYPKIEEVGIDKWKLIMGGYTSKILQECVNELQSNREGHAMDEDSIRKVFVSLNILSMSYIDSVIKSASEHYIHSVNCLISDNDDGDFVIRTIDKWLCLEDKRLSLINKDNEAKDAINDILVVDRIFLFCQQFKIALSRDIYEYVEMIYRIVSRVSNQVEHLSKTLETFIQEKNISDIVSLTKCYSHVRELVEKYCRNDKELIFSIERVFRIVLNRKVDIGSTIGFIDNVLRKNSKCKMIEEDRMKLLDDIIHLCKHYDCKDEFLFYYSERLRSRLIYDECSSKDLEDHAFQKLKQSFGLEYTQKIKAMFDDINNSRQLSDEFKVEDFHLIVLTKSIWTLLENTERPVINDTIKFYQERFSKYYSCKHSNRKLSWNYEESRVIVKYLDYSFICSFYQYCILDQFNRKSVISKKDLKSMSGINNEDVTNSLLKLKILWPSKDGEKYTLNPKFKHSINKINCLNALSKVDTKSQTKDVELELARQMQMRACLVRNMKKDKVMKCKALKSEVMIQMQINFIPTLKQFSEAIDYCLENEIIEVISKDSDDITYRYIN